MKRFFTFLKTELKLSLRDMNMPIFAVIMPLVIFIILGIITAQSQPMMAQIIHSWNSHSELSARLLFAQADSWAYRWLSLAYGR